MNNKANKEKKKNVHGRLSDINKILHEGECFISVYSYHLPYVMTYYIFGKIYYETLDKITR